MPAGAHNCVLPRWQKDVLPVIEQVGGVYGVTVLLHVLLHPFASVMVTLYVPAVLTVIHCVVAPVLHMYEAIPAGAHS